MDSEEVGLSWGKQVTRGERASLLSIHLSMTFSFFLLLAQQEVSHFGLFNAPQEQEQ